MVGQVADPHIKTLKTGADLLKDVPNRCSAHAKCQQTGPADLFP